MHRATWDNGDGPTVSSPAFVRRLGEAGYGPEDGRVGVLDLLARSGLPVPEGFVLTTEGHREFLRVSGLGQTSPPDVRGGAAHGTRGLGEALEREIRSALLDLRARTVVVGSAYGARRGLGTIPAVVAAVREAWTQPGAPERRIPPPQGAEIPTWPVLVQRQTRPEYAGWTTTADLRPGRSPLRAKVPLYDVEPVLHNAHEGISSLTRRAAGILEDPVRLDWGLEDGRWLLVSVDEDLGLGRP